MSTMTNEEAIKIIQGVRQYAYESGFMRDVEGFDFAIAALSAEPGEPAAWEITYPSGGKTITTDAGWITYLEAYPDHHVTPLYAAPPAPTVTDEMVERALKAWWSRMGDRGRSDNQLMRETLLAALQVKP